MKYFTGASLIETGVYTKESELNLLLAGTRDVPTKVFYYLARYYHANHDWDSALRFYNRFKNNSQPGQVAELRVDELTRLAYDHINPFTEGGNIIPKTKETLQPEPNSRIPQPEVIMPELTSQQVQNSTTIEIPVEEPVNDTTAEIPVIGPRPTTTAPPPSVTKFNFIRFQVNQKVTYLTEDLFQVAEAREAWKTGTENEHKINGFLEKLSGLRKQFQHTANPVQRDELAHRIIELERHTMELRAETDQLFQRARQLEQQWWANADFNAYERFLQVSDSLLRLQEALRTAPLLPPPINDEPQIPYEPDLTEEAADETPGPNEVRYKVQLGSFTSAVPTRTQSLFNKIGKIRPIETFVNEDGATVYVTGNMKTFEDGLALQNQIRVEGIKDAFVIAIKDGKRISLPESKKLTGEE